MSRWIDNSLADRLYMVNLVTDSKNIDQESVEKDWWVSMVLKCLFELSMSKYMFFKGGTSLSKGWNIINRFSEDIDIALYRDFFADSKGLDCAQCENNNQIKLLRKASRDYIIGELNEEYQRNIPRTLRMSRHLYDLEKLMDTEYAKSALSDKKLYAEVIEHRKKFYHVGGVDYALNTPDKISFCPTGKVLDLMRADYENMKSSFIYGNPLEFDELIKRLQALQERFRAL